MHGLPAELACMLYSAQTSVAAHMCTIWTLVLSDQSLVPFEYNCKDCTRAILSKLAQGRPRCGHGYINLLPPEGEFSSDTEKKNRSVWEEESFLTKKSLQYGPNQNLRGFVTLMT